MLAVELGQIAAHGQPGKVLQQQASLASSAKAQLPHQLLVSGFAAGGAGDTRDEFAISHGLRVGHDGGRVRSVRFRISKQGTGATHNLCAAQSRAIEPYSYRSATVGWTCAARIAGIRIATVAVASITTETMTNVVRSAPLMP